MVVVASKSNRISDGPRSGFLLLQIHTHTLTLLCTEYMTQSGEVDFKAREKRDEEKGTPGCYFHFQGERERWTGLGRLSPTW